MRERLAEKQLGAGKLFGECSEAEKLERIDVSAKLLGEVMERLGDIGVGKLRPRMEPDIGRNGKRSKTRCGDVPALLGPFVA